MARSVFRTLGETITPRDELDFDDGEHLRPALLLPQLFRVFAVWSLPQQLRAMAG
ncbi:MAG: hypothetical protein ACHQPH_10495 [Reyranellales bacterium]|jgi:hypothetical protein